MHPYELVLYIPSPQRRKTWYYNNAAKPIAATKAAPKLPANSEAPLVTRAGVLVAGLVEVVELAGFDEVEDGFGVVLGEAARAAEDVDDGLGADVVEVGFEVTGAGEVA
jgi:hypothetical protein